MDSVTAPATAPLATAAANSAPAEDRTVISSDFQTFLNMLTAQMKNQDPLDPVKSEDFAVQLATFSSVEQQVLTNDLLSDLGTQMNVMGMAQFAGWVGMEARAPVAAQFDGRPITLAPKPLITADSAVLVVEDASGTVVQRMPVQASDEQIAWTGLGADGTPLPHGAYSFKLESYSNGALAATEPVEVYTRVVEARSEGGRTVLVTEAGAVVDADSVSALRQPDAAS